MEAFMWRHHPRTKRFVALLPEIGDLQTIRTTFSWKMEPGNLDIRLEPALDGGSLMDVGCYCVSAARLIAGEELLAVHGEQVVGPSGVDVRFTGLLRFPGDVIAEFTSGFTTDHEGIEAIGSDGSILVEDPWTSKLGRIVVNGRDVPLEQADAYHHEFENFSRAIRGEQPQLLGRDDAIGQSRTIEALYRAAETGTSVDLSPTISA
jgi:predicted dehydrogenase